MFLLETLFSQETVARLGWMLVHFLWQASAVALLLAVMLRLLRRTAANLRYAIACGALALMVVLPVITMQLVAVPGPTAEVGPLPEISQSTAAETIPMPVRQVGELPPLELAPQTELPPVAIPWRERVVAILEPALPYLVLGWLAGVFGLSAWHLGGWTQLHRLKRRMARETGCVLRATLDELATKLRVRRVVTLLESALVEVPTVLGWLRPVILLPASALTGLNPDQLRAILAHELAHIRRHDYLANILQTVVEILGFYHPAVWWVSSRIRIERENCCDDLAVQVCGNSLQYARALTSMEEIRHSRSDLALAASGGSLMARIARLLGRPAVDDRRFAWLPGLVALLLVVAVVVPAALVFATPAPLPQNAEPPATERPDIPLADEPARTQVLLAFTILDVFADRVLDVDTAVQAADLLMQIRPADANQPGVPITPPRIEELGVPLRDVFARFEPIPLKAKQLTDLLVSRGYAETLSSPRILVFADDAGSIVIGQENDPNAPDSAPTGAFIRLTATPHVLEDQNAVRLQIDYEDRRAVAGPDGPNQSTSSTQIASTIAVPNDGYAAIVARDSGRLDARLRLLLIGPTTVFRPQHAAEQDTNAGAQTEIQIEQQNDAQGQDQTQITTNWVLVEARTEAILDRETLRLIGDVLAGERPQIARELAATGAKMTLGQVLKTYVVRQPLSQETIKALIDLLKSLKLAAGVVGPTLVVRDGEDFELRTISMEQFSIPAAKNAVAGEEPNVITVEYGTTIKGTSRVETNGNVTLEMNVTQAEPGPRTQPDALPVVRKVGASTAVTVPENRYFSLLVESTDETQQAKDARSLLIMVKPSVARPAPQPELTETRLLRLNHRTAQSARELLPREYQQYVQAEDRGNSEPDDAGYILTITAPAAIASAIQDAVRKLDATPRQVLLDVRIVEVERASLSKSGVEWQFPTASAGESGDRDDWAKRIQLGYSPDATSTNSLLATLNRLEATHQAEILSNPQVVAMDGRAAQLRSTQEEWFLMSDSSAMPPELQRSESGTILNITPRTNDSNAITLETAIEVFNTVPGSGGSALPIMTRRTAKNAVTITTGGTVAVAGLTSKQSDQTTKEIAIFITATLVPESDSIASSLPAPRKTGSSIASANHAASTDATAKPTPRPEITETRHLYLNFRTREQVKGQLPAEYQKYVHAESNSSRTLAVTAPVAMMDAITAMIRRLDSPPPQVLLDLQVFEIERAALKELGVDLSLPKEQAGESGYGWPKGIQLGLSPDPTHTRSLMAALSQLEDASRAELRTNPQTICRKGKRARLIAIRDEWFVMSEPDPNVIVCGPGWEKCACRAVLRTIPRIDDTNDITLEMAMSINDSLSIARTVELTLNELPQNTNPITIQSGGTVVVAGLPLEPGDESQPTRVIVILVTATRVPGISEVGSVSIGDKSVDPVVRALALEIAKTEQDLAVLRQTRAETHPEIVRQKAILKGLEDRLQSRLVESSDRDLQREANAGTERLATSSGEIKRSDPQTAAFRDARVNWDGVVREWATQIAAMEKEIIVLRQAYLPSHPALQQKQDALQDLYRKLEGRRKTLRDEQSQRDAELRASLNRQ